MKVSPLKISHPRKINAELPAFVHVPPDHMFTCQIYVVVPRALLWACVPYIVVDHETVKLLSSTVTVAPELIVRLPEIVTAILDASVTNIESDAVIFHNTSPTPVDVFVPEPERLR